MRFIQGLAVWSFYLLIFLVQSQSVQASEDNGFLVIQLREISYQNAPAVRVRFSQVLNASTIEDKIQLVHSEKGQVQLSPKHYSWVLDDDKASVIFPFVEPDREYQVLVDAKLQSQSGAKLDEYYAKSITTKHLAAQAVFSSNGYLMPLTGPKSLPVTVTNVEKVDVNFYFVPPDKYSDFLKTGLQAGTEYIYQLNRFVEEVEFVHTARFDVTPKKNQRTFVNLDVSQVTELQQPGLFVAVMSKAGKYDNHHSVIYFTVSDLAIHARQYQHKSLFHLMDLANGKPASSVKVSLYDKDGNLVETSRTDADGLSEIVMGPKVDASYVIAEYAKNITILPLKRSSLDLSDFDNALSPHADIQVFSFGPRDLFRPGEVAQTQMLLRDYDGQQLSNIPLTITLTRPDGQVAHHTVLQPQAAGYYQFNYQLAQTAQTGQWKVSYQAAGQDLQQYYYFKVEDFRPHRLSLEQLTQQQNLYLKGNDKVILANLPNLTNHLEGHYLFGAKASGNKIDAVINAKFDRYPLPEYKNFAFGDQREQLYLKNRYISSFKLDQNGAGKIAINNPWHKFQSPIKLTYSVSLYDGGAQPMTAVQPVTLVQTQGLVGIKPEFSGEPDKDAQVGFSVLALDQAFLTLGNQSLKVRLIKEDRNYYWSHDRNRGWQFKYDAAPYEVWSTQVTTDALGQASVKVPLEYGHYQLIVTDRKQGVTSTYNFKTAGRWWSNSRESKNKPDAILMSFDKTQYQVGESAQLDYFSPHNGHAWFTVENNQGVVYQTDFAVEAGENTLQVNVDDSWQRHDYYATLMIVKQNEGFKGAKTRAFGLVHLPVQRPNMALDVELAVPPTSLPLKTVTAEVKVAEPEILTGDTYAVVALVDVGILNISQYHRPKPERYFLTPRRYQVALSDVYDRLIEQHIGKTVNQAFGGDLLENEEALTRGGKTPDAEIELLSMLSNPVKLDSNGTAQVDFELPEFAGKLRWSVVVFNASQFGSSEQFTQVSSPFVTHLSAPYFMTPTDQAKSVLEIHNTTATAQEVLVSIATSGGLVGLPQELRQRVSAGEKALIDISLKSTGVLHDGVIDYTVKNLDVSPQYVLEKQHRIPMRSAYPAVTQSDYFTLDIGEAWQPNIDLSTAVAGSVAGQLTLSATPPLSLNQHFDYLLAYPYGCLEQTTSRAFPWLTIDKNAVERFGLEAQIKAHTQQPFSEELRQVRLLEAIDGLKQKQRPDGAFSLWNGAADEYSWLSVYATEFLVDAAASGIQVPNRMVDRAINVLRRYVRRPLTIKGNGWSEQQDYYRHSVRAYASYVLAKAKRVNLSDLRRVDKALKTSQLQGGLPWAHLAASFKLLGAENDSQSAIDRINIDSRPSGYLGDYGSDVRDLAWVYRLSLQHGFNLDVDFFALQYEVNQRRWLSTQDRAQLFKLATLLETNQKTFSGEIVFDNQTTQEVQEVKRFNAILNGSQINDIDQVRATHGKVYGTFSHSIASHSAPESKLDVINLEKTFFDIDGFPTGLDSVKSGQLLIVEVLLQANKNIKDALVIDLLPAGLIIENQNLGGSSVDISSLEVEGEAISVAPEVAHQEFREDRYIAALALQKGQPIRLYYLVRASAPGQYLVPPTYVEDMFNPIDHGIGVTAELIIDE